MFPTETEILEHQADAEAGMNLTIAWYSPGAVTVVDGMEVPGFTSQGTTKAKLQSPVRQGKDITMDTMQVGGVERTIIRAGLHIPVGAMLGVGGLLVKPDWEAEVTEVAAGGDTAVAGSRWRILEPMPMKSHMSARRFDVVQVL